MIYGIGNDVVYIPRISRIVQSDRVHRFVHKLLNAHERTALESIAAPHVDVHIAGRWALKEAIAKMLGCGIGNSVSFHDITIARNARGRPIALIDPVVWERLGINATLHIHVSLSHDADIAYAIAIGAYVDPMRP
ncbi:MAG: holo-ACP synthase [Paenibacillaceae bacterium]|nr:holo-ACP synthase [Paenibacillaceae bacterium]